MDSFSAFAFSSPRMEKPSLSSTPRPSYLVETPSRALPSSYSSPRTIYSDRFIPSRIGSNFTLFDLSPSPSASSSSDVSGREYGSGAYAALLRNALFGPDQGVAPPATPDRSAEAAGRRSSSAASSTSSSSGFSIPSRNIFRYKADVPRHSLATQFEDGLPGFPHIHPRAPRKVSPSPYKVGSLFVFLLELSLFVIVVEKDWI